MMRAACLGASLLAMISLAWIGGLLWFGLDALRLTQTPPRADGIVALTGGRDRIEAAVSLLSDGYARRLLVSGVGPRVTLTQLAARDGVTIPAALLPKIDLGRRAVSTIGNGIETAAWAERHHVRSLIVVTAGYHIRRAITEIGRASPDVVVYAYRVRPPALRHPFNRNSIRLIIGEYDKWLGSKLRLSSGYDLAS